MDKAAHREVQEQLFLLARMARGLDADQVREFVRANSHALTVSLILSPSAYMAGHERLQAANELAGAFLKFHAAAVEFADVAADEALALATLRTRVLEENVHRLRALFETAESVAANMHAAARAIGIGEAEVDAARDVIAGEPIPDLLRTLAHLLCECDSAISWMRHRPREAWDSDSKLDNLTRRVREAYKPLLPSPADAHERALREAVRRPDPADPTPCAGMRENCDRCMEAMECDGGPEEQHA